MKTAAIALIPLLILSVFPLMAYASARTARRKGQSFWLWFAIGLALGPFGILIAHLLRPTLDSDGVRPRQR